VLPLAVALICLRSLVHSGYLLQVDIVFGPRAAPIPSGFGAPVAFVQAVVTEVFGGQTAGKLYAVGTLFAAGFGPMVLLRRTRWYTQVTAGMLGALNPWTYARVAEGQWGVAVAAAGLFLWVAAWEHLWERSGWRAALLLAVCAATIIAFDPHAVGPLAVLGVAAFLWQGVWRNPLVLRWLGTSVALLALFLAYGVVSFFVADERGGYSAVRQFSRADFAFFRSTPSADYGLIANVAGLYGYWGERFHRFPLANESPWWPLSSGLVFIAALVGAWICRERAWLLICGLVGLALSVSTALHGGVSAATRLAELVPPIAAFREPQKWDALWLLALVALSASAVDAVAARTEGAGGSRRWVAPALAYLLILAALFPAGVTQIRSLPEMVKPLQYPGYWYRSAAYLDRNVGPDERVAVLPWHLYQSLAFSEGRLVANPARQFFTGRMLVPQNLEIPGRATELIEPEDRIGLVAAATGQGSCAVGRELRRQRVRWVLVLDAAEGRETVRGLQRCGFKLLQGRAGRTALLRA
jgi:hypothetical protein